MTLLLLARACARRPLVAGVRPAHSDAGADGPACRPAPCGAPAARPPPPPARVVCTPPPPTGHPPPCPPPALPRTRTCEDALTEQDHSATHQRSTATTLHGRCGLELDAVSRRLAAEQRARREHYEREVSARAPAPPADFARYCLAAAADAAAPAACPDDTTNCQIHRHEYADLCAQYPRKEVHLDRGPDVPVGSKGFAARIMDKLKRANSTAERSGPCPPGAGRCGPHADAQPPATPAPPAPSPQYKR